ncbi:hypothetical protein HYH03_017408 [Edaphochlamys debaryana]|uniref:Tyrosine specific protein phosphatases domain-containing protein n=1 Tax=Edaphochlamys debaryana TaxID=47281 RepID=A0A835XGP3_9CHLO|nr:hypothetical protein HYH03_017408 [Edaphochlamys debaryana]|eukprot:KAG2483753.1 hypothetical protein HYH03_017408 [Edaphochlamys debaryana]
MSCKADAKYNFGRASEHDEIVYGAARPGAASQRCFNENDKVTVPEIEEWADSMAAHGIQRVVSLLSTSEVGTYTEPPTPVLARRFKRAVLLDAKAPGAVGELVGELRAAQEAGEKVVVHCWGGGGRTGLALAAWLVRGHGMEPEAAAAHVESYAKAQGASRRADVAQLREWLDK